MNLQQSSSLKYLMFIILSSFISADETVVKLTLDFINYQIEHVSVCNFIICSESEHLKIIKKFSSTHVCFLNIQRNLSINNSYHLQPNHRSLFVVENSCPSSRKYLQQANYLGLLRSKHIWLLIRSPEAKETTNLNPSFKHTDDGNFEDLELTISSEVFLAEETSRKRFKVTGIYKRDPDDQLVKEYINNWDFSKGFDGKILECAAIRRQNLYGRVFSAAIVLTDPKSLEHSDDLVDIHIDSLSKVNYAMVSLVTSSLNASTNFIITTSWGNKVNGTFDGMIGLVEKGKAEIAVTQSFPTEERLEVVEYIDKAVRTGTGYIFLSPPLSFKRNIFILPFDEYVWFTYVGLVLLTMPLLYYASKWESKEKGRRRKSYEYDWYKRRFKSYSWGDIVMLNFASFCIQGASHAMDPPGAAGRIIIITLLVTVIFISVSYNAYIMVLLQSTDRSIVSLADLLESNLELGVYNTTYMKYYYSTAEDPIRKAISKKIFSNKKNPPFISVEEGVEKLRSERYAFDVEKSPGYQMVKAIFTEEEKCRLQEIKQTFTLDIEPMLSIKKDFSYGELLKIKFERLHERGLANRIGVRLYTKKPACTSSTSSHFSISLMDTHHIFRLLAFAVLTSWIFLIFEIFAYKKKVFDKIERFMGVKVKGELFRKR